MGRLLLAQPAEGFFVAHIAQQVAFQIPPLARHGRVLGNDGGFPAPDGKAGDGCVVQPVVEPREESLRTVISHGLVIFRDD
jgi:hypothetical protein